MNRPLRFAFAATLDLDNIDACYTASDLVCPGATRPNLAHAKVHGQERGSLRKVGVAVIWGDDSRKTRSLVNACPDPIVLVLCPTRPNPSGTLAKAMSAVAEAGRRCWLIQLSDAEPLVIVRAGLGEMAIKLGDVQPIPAPAATPSAPAPDVAEPVPDSPVVASAEVEAPTGTPG